MKIQQDVTDQLKNYSLKRAAQATTPPARGINLLSQAQSSGGLRANSKSLTEALAIARMSQAIVNQALVLSSQLKSIASSAMLSGGVNRNELSSAMAGIATLQNQASETRTLDAPALSGGQVVIPGTASALNDLEEGATGLGSTPMDTGPLARAHENLNTLSTMLEKPASQINSAAGFNTQDLSPVNAEATTRIVTGSIRDNPAHSLMSQGNLTSSRTNTLL